MAEHLEKDMLNLDARYTNPVKHHGQKKPRIDLSLGRADWVAGCSAAAPRRDTLPPQFPTSSRAAAGGSAGYGFRGRGGFGPRGSLRSLKRGAGHRGGRARRGWGRGVWGSF
jgi:hypothetical protein